VRTKPIENPYNAPDSPLGEPTESSESSPPFNRAFTALCLGLVGAPVGAILCSVGYLAVIFVLETAFVPPLHSPENYGQFGFLLIIFGFFGLFFGASFALIPYTRFLLWLPVFAIISLVATSGDVAAYFDPTEVTCTAMLVVGALIVAFAFVTSAVISRLDRRTTWFLRKGPSGTPSP
jgi:hypothetical protein